MNFFPPLGRQLIVASSPQLAALSVGGMSAYPAVLLNQLQRDDSSIELDLETSSWIASIHGLAGIPSIFIATIMQWRGRRFAFIAASLSILIGWILTYFATNAATILVGESFHGFSGNSLIAVSLITISEMVDPTFRSISMMLFGLMQVVGIVFVTLAGYFLHWRAVSIVMVIPTLISLLLASIWPESPSWLACKGEFAKCEEAFILLRGTGNEATKELTELVSAQKESLRQISLKKSEQKSLTTDFWLRLKSKDFYKPIMHVILIMFIFNFSGPLIIFTYAIDIIADTSKESDFIYFIHIDVVLIISSILSIIFMKYFNNKSIFIASLLCSGFFLFLVSGIKFCKNLDIYPKQAVLVCILCYIFCFVSGSSNLTFNLSAELIPVKHRGFGGSLFIIISCLFHSVSLKIAPYLFETIYMSGTFLLFALVAISGALLIGKFVPETKGRTLQEIENYYNYGSFVDSDTDKRLCDKGLEMHVISDDNDID